MTPERDAVARERRRLIEQIAALDAAHAAIVEDRDQGGTDDEHDPDGSTIAFERAQVASLRSEAQDRLVALDEADARIRAGSYGTCARCGAPIGADRLDALPATPFCVDCAVAASAAREDLRRGPLARADRTVDRPV
jgi:RNA polymerase-binding transcription factor DksA